MKITVEQSDLSKALSNLSMLLRSSNQALRQVRLTARAGSLIAEASDSDRYAEIRLEATVQEEGSIAADGNHLQSIVAGCPTGAQISLARDNGILVLRAGTGRYRLPAWDLKNTAERPKIEGETFLINSDVLCHALETTLPAVAGRDDNRLYTHGVLIEIVKKRLRFVASDGNRLASVTTDLPEGASAVLSSRESIVLPGDAVRLALKLAPEGGTVAIKASRALMELDFGDTVMTSKLIDAEYPQLDRIIPTPMTLSIDAPRAELLAAVDRLIPFGTTSGMSGGRGIFFKAGGNVIQLAVQNESGAGVEKIDAETPDREIGFGLNAVALRTALSSTDSERVRMDLHEDFAKKPSIMTFPGAPEIKWLLCAVAVNEPSA